jgi:C4-dicarboxylate-specific signal transduction histidine kinase
VAALLQEYAGDLGNFFTRDPKGKIVPGFIGSLARLLTEETAWLLEEIDSLQKNIDHIKEIVSMQQAYATMAGVVEKLVPAILMDDALRMNTAALRRHDVAVVRDFQPVPRVVAERGKVLQILGNLIGNAKHAVDKNPVSDRTVTVRIEPGAAGTVRFIVKDNGTGIPPETIGQIFDHGFTTKAKGHGFGLHSSMIAARDMRGALTAHSEGPGSGATFVLELPGVEEPASEAIGSPAVNPPAADLAPKSVEIIT